MSYTLSFKPYQRRFRKPLQTHHGLWEVREGLLVGLHREDGAVGWGEVAPIPWFGTEMVEEAISYFQHLPQVLSESDIFAIPDTLPCCQFGIGSAWEMLHGPQSTVELAPEKLSALLPAGEAACEVWPRLWQKGHRTLKWKIGVLLIDAELEIFRDLTNALPEGAQLRLDANGGLSLLEAQRWLETCDHLRGGFGGLLVRSYRTPPVQVEYVEQPLPPVEFEAMQHLSNVYHTPIALDESVATLGQLIRCHEADWRGVMVIKAAIAGYPQALREFLATHPVDVVFSSVFETEVGRATALALARVFNHKDRAIGFGVEEPLFI
jgi:o-succinylbenzoate synthase